jgi:hypothetical protein
MYHSEPTRGVGAACRRGLFTLYSAATCDLHGLWPAVTAEGTRGPDSIGSPADLVPCLPAIEPMRDALGAGLTATRLAMAGYGWLVGCHDVQKSSHPTTNFSSPDRFQNPFFRSPVHFSPVRMSVHSSMRWPIGICSTLLNCYVEQ